MKADQNSDLHPCRLCGSFPMVQGKDKVVCQGSATIRHSKLILTREEWAKLNYIDRQTHHFLDMVAIKNAALCRAKLMIEIALPQFDWGKSALSAEAIKLLNETPIIINEALKKE